MNRPVSKEDVMLLMKSPAHYAHAQNSRTEMRQRAPDLVKTVIFNPDGFDKHFALAPSVSRRKQSGKKAWADFSAAANGRQIVTAEQLREAIAIGRSVLKHSSAELINSGMFAQAFSWRDSQCGVDVAATVDCVVKTKSGSAANLLDLIVVDDASRSAVIKLVKKRGIHIGAAMAMDGYRATHSAPGLTYQLIAVERDPPHVVSRFLFQALLIEAARIIYKDALKALQACEQANEWPGYQENNVIVGVDDL